MSSDNKDLIIGPLKSGKLRMPLHSSDARLRTWYKTISVLDDSVTNSPTSADDCWFIECNTGDGYPMVKLSGNADKFKITRLLWVLMHPEDYGKVAKDCDDKWHLAHRCGRGKAQVELKNGKKTAKGNKACINPAHLVLVDCKTNQDHKGCKYGCAALCPHMPKCLFTWHDTGCLKPCLNNTQSHFQNATASASALTLLLILPDNRNSTVLSDKFPVNWHNFLMSIARTLSGMLPPTPMRALRRCDGSALATGSRQ
jgi:hypothetical protein